MCYNYAQNPVIRRFTRMRKADIMFAVRSSQFAVRSSLVYLKNSLFISEKIS